MDKAQLELAQNYFLKGQYDLASNVYRDLSSTSSNPYLLLNAGVNDYYNKNNGQALLKFLKAKKQIPRDKILNKNIKIIQNEINLTQPNFLSLELLTLNESLWILLVINLLFILKNRITKNKFVRNFFSLLFATSLSLSAWIYIGQEINKNSVVVSRSAIVYSGDNENYSELGELLEGQIVRNIKSNDNDWVQIAHKNLRGWVKEEQISLI